jgi:hypothetical protein
LSAQLGVREFSCEFREGLFDSLDTLIDFVVIAHETFDADDGFGGEVIFWVKSGAVGGCLVLSDIASLFECERDAYGELFSDLLELGCGAILELRKVCGEVLEEEAGFRESICEHEHAGEFEPAGGVGLVFFSQGEDVEEVLSGDGVEGDCEFPVMSGAGDDGIEFIDAGNCGGDIAGFGVIAECFSAGDPEFIEGVELREYEGAWFAALSGARDVKRLCGPCGDIGNGGVGSAGRDVDFAVALIDEFEEEFLFNSVNIAAVGWGWSEAIDGRDHAVQDEAIAKSDGGGDWFFAFDGENANFAWGVLGFIRCGAGVGVIIREGNCERDGCEGCEQIWQGAQNLGRVGIRHDGLSEFTVCRPSDSGGLPGC